MEDRIKQLEEKVAKMDRGLTIYLTASILLGLWSLISESI